MWEKVVSVQYPRYPIPNVTVHRPLRWQLLDFCNDPVRLSFTCPDTIYNCFIFTHAKKKKSYNNFNPRNSPFFLFLTLFSFVFSASKQSRWFPKTKIKKTITIFWFWTFVLKGLFGLSLLLLKLKTENWKYCSKIIFKCVNSTVRPIFNIF